MNEHGQYFFAFVSFDIGVYFSHLKMEGNYVIDFWQLWSDMAKKRDSKAIFELPLQYPNLGKIGPEASKELDVMGENRRALSLSDFLSWLLTMLRMTVIECKKTHSKVF